MKKRSKKSGPKARCFTVKVSPSSLAALQALPYCQPGVSPLTDMTDWFVEKCVLRGLEALAVKARESGGRLTVPFHFAVVEQQTSALSAPAHVSAPNKVKRGNGSKRPFLREAA